MGAQRKQRVYSLFEQHTLPDGRIRYVRLSNLNLTLRKARKVFQNSLLAFPLGAAEHPRVLRPTGEHFGGVQGA